MRGIHQSDSAEVSEKALGQLKIMLDVLKYYRTPLVRPAMFFLISASVRVRRTHVAHLRLSLISVSGAIREPARRAVHSRTLQSSRRIRHFPASGRLHDLGGGLRELPLLCDVVFGPVCARPASHGGRRDCAASPSPHGSQNRDSESARISAQLAAAAELGVGSNRVQGLSRFASS